MIIQSDYHIHATYYRPTEIRDDSFPKAHEQVKAARAAGSRIVGVLEHCNHSPRHPFYCLEDLSAEYYAPGFDRENVFLGVEADLEEDGSDACGKAGREKLRLHYVIGSVHLAPPEIADVHDYIVSEYKRISNALKYNDNVEIIGHPFGEGMRWEKSGNVASWQWSLIPQKFLDDIIRLAGETGKALEVNRNNIADPVYRDFLLRIRDEKVMWSVGSDAHTTDVTSVAASQTKMLENLGFSEEQHWGIKI